MSLTRESRDIPRRFPWGALATVCVAIALVVAAKIVVDGLQKVAREPEHRTLEATGTAKRRVPAQQIAWDLTATVHGKDCAPVLKQLAASTEALHAFLAEHAVKPDDIEVAGATCEADQESEPSNYDMGGAMRSVPNKVTASQKLTVRSRDVAHVLAAFRAATRAPALSGIEIAEPACSLNDPDPGRRELTAAAHADARSDAEQKLAKLGGASLDALLSESSSFDLDPGASSTVPSCEQGIELVATVRATYRIE